MYLYSLWSILATVTTDAFTLCLSMMGYPAIHHQIIFSFFKNTNLCDARLLLCQALAWFHFSLLFHLRYRYMVTERV